jgi:Spy/CpxP family protein refolding chaperone
MSFKYLSTLVLFMALARPAAAQLAPLSPAAQAGVASQAQRMTQELGLSPDQHARLRQALLLTRQHMDADLAAHHDDPGALRTAMAFDRAKSDELIRGVLTPAQYVRYQQLKAARIGQLHSTSQVGR